MGSDRKVGQTKWMRPDSGHDQPDICFGVRPRLSPRVCSDRTGNERIASEAEQKANQHQSVGQCIGLFVPVDIELATNVARRSDFPHVASHSIEVTRHTQLYNLRVTTLAAAFPASGKLPAMDFTTLLASPRRRPTAAALVVPNHSARRIALSHIIDPHRRQCIGRNR